MNNKFAYALMFDRDDQINYKELHHKLISLECVKNWFHYIKSSYILISDLPTAYEFNKEVSKVLKDKNYLIVAIDLKDIEGWLPGRAWSWVDSQKILT